MKRVFSRWSLLVVIPVAVLVLECLPLSLVMRFMGDPGIGTEYLTYVSYFDFLVVGYGNWGPFLAGVLTCVLVLLGIINYVRPHVKLRKWIRNLAAVAFICSLTCIFFNEMTGFSYVISGLLLAETLLAAGLKE